MQRKSITYLFIIFTSTLVLQLTSCSEPYFPSTQTGDQEIVVEGYVEAGEGSNPTIVFLTKSIPFLSEVGPETFGNIFIKDAEVIINDGEKDVVLQGLCLNDLPEPLRRQAAEILGFNPDSVTANLCAYVDLFDALIRESGRSYSLTARVGDKIIRGFTTIPQFVPLENFTWEDTPGEPSDTLANLKVFIKDPPDRNFYRYWTAQTGESLTAPFNSVIEDDIFNGQEFEFPLSKAFNFAEQDDPDNFGLYTRGDSVTIKWATIDQEHFDFWNTRDAAANSGGPFSGYTRVKSNVEGAIGIFGGYAVEVYSLYCPPK